MRTEKQKLANWTELVHPGENVEIDKGVISASGSGGSGGGGGSFKIIDNVDGNLHTLDKTWNEIMTAVNNGLIPYVVTEIPGLGPITYATIIDMSYETYPVVYISLGGSIRMFSASDGDSPISYDTLG